jgi:hypothetical protein
LKSIPIYLINYHHAAVKIMTERGAADREEAVGIGIQLGRATSAPTVPHLVRLKRIGLRTTGRAHSFSFGSSHDPDQLIKKNIRQQAYFRGEDILVTSLLPAEFRERQHELTTIVKRLVRSIPYLELWQVIL